MSKKPSLFILFITVFIDLVGFGIIIPLHAYFAREFQADAFEVGILMSIYSLMQFVFAPIWGKWSDRLGRRPILLLSLLGAGCAHILFAFASSYSVLFIARLLAGVFGANISTAMAYAADISPPEKRSQSMGLIGAAIGLGFVFGPFIGGVLGSLNVPYLGMGFGAFIAGVICLANTLLAFFVLPESRKVQVNKVVAPASERMREKWTGVVRGFKHSKLKFPMLVYLVCMIAMGHMEVSMFLYLDDKFAWPMRHASYGFAFMGLIMVFTQGYLIRKFLPKWGEQKTLLIGLTLYSAALALVGFSNEISTLAIAVTGLGLGIGLSNPAMTGTISLLGSDSAQGETMGVTQSLAALGRILGPALGSLYYRDLAPEAPFWIGGTMVFVSLLLVALKSSHFPSTAKVQEK